MGNMNRFWSMAGLLAGAALLIPGIANGAEIDAVQFHVSIYRYGDQTYTLIGDGFIRYDQAALDQQIDDWIAQGYACEESEDACDGFSYSMDFVYPLIEAEFEIYGHRFQTEDIVWSDGYDWLWPGASLMRMQVDMGHPYDDPYVHFGGGEDVVVLAFGVNGNTAECHELDCGAYVVGEGYDDDFRGFDWVEEPIPAPEPPTLALLVLGLAGILLSPRESIRKKQAAPKP
jgi:hypothetical protein